MSTIISATLSQSWPSGQHCHATSIHNCNIKHIRLSVYLIQLKYLLEVPNFCEFFLYDTNWLSLEKELFFRVSAFDFLVNRIYLFQRIIIKKNNEAGAELCQAKHSLILILSPSCLVLFGPQNFDWELSFHGSMTKTRSIFLKIFIENIDFSTNQNLIEEIVQNCAKTKGPT